MLVHYFVPVLFVSLFTKTKKTPTPHRQRLRVAPWSVRSPPSQTSGLMASGRRRKVLSGFIDPATKATKLQVCAAFIRLTVCLFISNNEFIGTGQLKPSCVSGKADKRTTCRDVKHLENTVCTTSPNNNSPPWCLAPSFSVWALAAGRQAARAFQGALPPPVSGPVSL